MLKKPSINASRYRQIIIPITLVVLFVIQNIFFNKWLGLYSGAYFVRLSLVTLGLGVVFYGPALLFKKKYMYLYLFLISFLVSFIFSAQFLYYRYFQSFLQFSAVKYAGEAISVTGTIKALISPGLFLFLANLIIVAIIFFIDLKKNTKEYHLPVVGKAVLIFIMICMVFFGYKYLLYTEKKEWGSTSRLYTDVYDLKALVGKMGIMNFFLEDTFKYVLRRNLVSEKDKEFLQNWAEKRKTQNTQEPTKAKYFGSQKGKNLIIIQVESLENVVINKKIGDQEITPNLNKIAAEGLYFDNYYAQAGPGNTADAEFCTMTSLYPLPDDVAFINYAKNYYKALPELLTKKGYSAYSFHGDVPTFWNRSNIYPNLGYQKSYNLDDYTVTRSVGKGPSDLGDEDLFSQTLPRLEKLPQPFMATVITMTSHTPFILPEDLQTLQIPAETTLDKNQQNYLQSIHYTDKAIGEFIDELKSNGLFDNSLIFIWGDHGSFTNISSALNKDTNTQSILADTQVPMIMLAPGTDLRGINKTPSSHLDIYPTIANLLDIIPPKSILGQDMLNAKNPVETNFKAVSGGVRAILTKNLQYQASDDGIFIDGSCESLPDKKNLPIENCRNLYTQQSETLRASAFVIKGNLLQTIAK